MYKYLLSVIIPVYNCEKYLERSINSLLSQTIFEQIEFIFVNDGSKDASQKIIENYANKYSNIKLLTQNNLGVSAARNLGIKNATCQYLAFFDADDEADPALYETLYSLIIEYKADISVVDYCMKFEDGTIKKHRKKCIKRLNSKNKIIKTFFKDDLICNNPVDKLFKRSILDNIWFPEGYAIGEDMYFLYNALNSTNSIIIDSTKALYTYHINPESAMKTKFNDKHFDGVLLAKKILDSYEKSNPIYSYAEANYIHEICKMLGLLYNGTYENKYLSKSIKWKKELKNYSNVKAFLFMNKKHTFAYLLMKLSPHLYVKLYNLLKIG